MSAADRRHLRLTCCGIYALGQLEQVARELDELPRLCGCGCGDEDASGTVLRREAVQEVSARAIQALIMEGSPLEPSPAPLDAPGVTMPVRIEVQRHGDHGRWGWRWRVVLMGGTGAARRPLEVLAQGVAPTEALADGRAFRAWEAFGHDYPGHYELEGAGG